MKTMLLLPMLFVLSCGVCLAQGPGFEAPAPIHPTETKPIESVIYVGQPIDEVTEVLKANQITASNLAQPFPRLNAKVNCLAFTIDLDHVSAYVFYEKTSNKTVGLTIICKPFWDADKSSESYLEAKRIRFNADRTYDIRFEPPAEPEFAQPAFAALPVTPANIKPLIYQGQPLGEAESTLKLLKIDFGSGRRAIEKPKPGLEEYSFHIDASQTEGVLIFSKSTRKVLSLGVMFRPTRQQQSDSTDLSVLAWGFFPDGSHEIRFTAPLTNEERDERNRKWANIKNVYPTPENTPPNPQKFAPAPIKP